MQRNTADAEVVSGGVHSEANLYGIHDDFSSFRSDHALLKAHIPRSESDWAYYQAGPIGQSDPIVFLHGTSGTAAAFFYQVKLLSAKGYRAISAQYPAYPCPEEWCKGFDYFLDMLKCKSVHIFGAGLGGYLSQHFASRYPNRTRSLILCNAFTSTRAFAERAGALVSVVHLTPTPILRKIILDSFPQVPMTLQVKQSIDFVAGQVNEISGTDIAGRLCLNSTEGAAPQVNLDDSRITIIESSGETMVPDELRRELRHRYSTVRVAEMKSSGDFPFLSQPEEVAMFVEVHMRGIGDFGGGQTSMNFSEGDSAANSATYTGARTSTASAGYVAQAAEEPPAPAPRPKWINPFEDPPVKPRFHNPFQEDPLL